jgi:hypothetical protein
VRWRAVQWRSPAALAALVAVLGAFFIGWVGGIAGFIGGLAAARRPRAPFLLAAVALFIAAVLTIVDGPLGERDVYSFPQEHELANGAGAIAGIMLLAGVVGLIARVRAATNLSVRPGGRIASGSRRVPISTVVSVVAASVVGAIALATFGDHDWGRVPVGLPLLACVVGLMLLVIRPPTESLGDHPDA